MRETNTIHKKTKNSKKLNVSKIINSINDWSKILRVANKISKNNLNYGIQIYKQAIKKFQNENLLIYQYANFLYENDKIKDSFRINQSFLKNHPSNVDSIFLQGLIFAKLGNYKKSKKSLSRALEIDPKNPKIHNYLGLTLTDLNELEQAIKHFNFALKFEENNEFYDNKARAYYRLGKFHIALKNVNKALQFEPQNFYSIIRKGFILQELGNSKESLECFKKILSIKSNYASFLAIQCRAYIELNMPKQCIAIGNEFLKYTNYKEAVFTDIGRSYMNMKNNYKAEQFFKKAIKSNSYPWANYYYAKFKVLKNDYPEAVKQLRLAMKKLPWIQKKIKHDDSFYDLLKHNPSKNQLFIPI